eukprot:PhF_6_TR10868/c0_g1_i2/m.17619
MDILESLKLGEGYYFPDHSFQEMIAIANKALQDIKEQHQKYKAHVELENKKHQDKRVEFAHKHHKVLKVIRKDYRPAMLKIAPEANSKLAVPTSPCPGPQQDVDGAEGSALKPVSSLFLDASGGGAIIESIVSPRASDAESSEEDDYDYHEEVRPLSPVKSFRLSSRPTSPTNKPKSPMSEVFAKLSHIIPLPNRTSAPLSSPPKQRRQAKKLANIHHKTFRFHAEYGHTWHCGVCGRFNLLSWKKCTNCSAGYTPDPTPPRKFEHLCGCGKTHMMATTELLQCPMNKGMSRISECYSNFVPCRVPGCYFMLQHVNPGCVCAVLEVEKYIGSTIIQAYEKFGAALEEKHVDSLDFYTDSYIEGTEVVEDEVTTGGDWTFMVPSSEVDAEGDRAHRMSMSLRASMSGSEPLSQTLGRRGEVPILGSDTGPFFPDGPPNPVDHDIWLKSEKGFKFKDLHLNPSFKPLKVHKLSNRGHFPWDKRYCLWYGNFL